MGIVWQNSSYNQPPHLGYYLPDYLGIDGTTYTTQTVSHAPEASKPADPTEGEETLKVPAEDKGTIKGTCYTAGENGELTASQTGNYIKMRTNNNGETISFSVNEGYVITGMKIEGYSNNTSTTADRSIYMTGMFIDGSENSILDATVTFPGGTAGQTPVVKSVNGFNATKSIKLAFDNKNITSGDVDSKGKNKQIFAIVTFNYKKTTDGIAETLTETIAISNGKTYNLSGQRIAGNMAKGNVYIRNGKKFVSK